MPFSPLMTALMLLPAVLALGIAGAIYARYRKGRFRRRVPDIASARREWLRHFEDDAVQGVDLTRSAALILTDAGPGLLRAFGPEIVAHRIREMSEHGGALRIRLVEPILPPVTLRLGQEEILALDDPVAPSPR